MIGKLFGVLFLLLVVSFTSFKVSARMERIEFAKSLAQLMSDKTYVVKTSDGGYYDIPDWDGDGHGYEAYTLERLNKQGQPTGITILYLECKIDSGKLRIGSKVRLDYSEQQVGGEFQQNDQPHCYVQATPLP